jgi:cation diffusion facilitator family transporter
MNKKISIARLSVASNTLLIGMKLVVGIISGSVSIISEAIHSTMDLLAAIIAFLSVKISDKPADSKHPYGHGKFENVSGVIEAILIFIAAGWIIYEASKKLISPHQIESLGIASLVMFISAGVNIYVSKRLYKVAKETESIALEADALHLKTDVYTSLGVGTGILLIWITGWNFFDPIFAIIVALFIIRESYELLTRAYSPLLDTSLSKKELDTIEKILFENHVNYHELKSRKSGNYKFVELHIEMPPDTLLEDVHKKCDEIEAALKGVVNFLDVQIHVEPVNIHSDNESILNQR